MTRDDTTCTDDEEDYVEDLPSNVVDIIITARGWDVIFRIDRIEAHAGGAACTSVHKLN